MTDHPVHRDDIAALRHEGDLSNYLRGLIRPTRTKATAPTPPRRPGHKPGAWPQGSQPPGPPPERDYPPEAWADAVRRYRTETRHQLDQEDK